ncbi:hypothetical protein [Streptomyces spirodelae]|uniref:Pyrrolo-quinoline quinone repeat domain-containing protein n=1 Tax=Streptomyces spirodelae TaxID=2812904 RepID=A0ABS3WZA1_9ACTN|nr:hypothetical protein [Streptomyces spirodelae]MBO8188470.1 hypothetical protein [Streptomyces spirodelae]
MSQPPPPPSQPPPGGFGAPQEPPRDQQGQPSYGYPQQPGSDQSYGYPQQPPQPPQGPAGTPSEPPTPAAPSGYGYPQQNAHAAPTQAAFGAVTPPPPGPPGQPPGPPGPPGPPPGGYGQQPPAGYPYANTAAGAPGGGGGGRNNSKIIAVVAGVVAVAVIAVGVVFFVTKDDGGKKNESKGDDKKNSQQKDPNTPPKDPQAKQIVDLKAPEVKDYTDVGGGWATDKVFAKSSVREMIIKEFKSGSETKISLKGNVCAASNGMTEDHKVAVVVQETISNSADCTRMVIVDLDAKKIAWDKTMPNADTRSVDSVAISGDTVAAAWIGGSVGYKISTKKELWKAKPSECRDVGYAGGKKLFAVVECGSSIRNPQVSVQRLNPDSGKSEWKYDPPKGVRNVRIASTEPLVLVAGAGDELTSDVLTVGEDKKLKAKISLGDRYERPCRVEVNSCYSIAVGPDSVYLATTEHDGGSDSLSRINEVMAFDFNTGRTKWKSSSGDSREIVPFKMQGSNVVAYKTPSIGHGGEIVTIEPKKGKQTTLLKMPASDFDEGEQAFSVSPGSLDTPLIFEHNRFFLLENTLSENRSSLRDEEPRLAVGFAPSGE